MSSAPSSRVRPRHLRRAGMALGALAIFVVAVVIGKYAFTNSSGSDQTPYTAPRASQIEKQAHQRTVKVAPEAKRVLIQFLKTAVVRQHTARSWNLVSDDLKSGYTRASWAKGDIPIIPFPPLVGAKFRQVYSHPNEAEMQVALFPKIGYGQGAMVFVADVHRYGKRWKVSYWAPKPSSGVKINTSR